MANVVELGDYTFLQMCKLAGNMQLQYCSDLHLEFRENAAFLKENPLNPKGDILLLAGDIVPFALMEKHAAFFDFVSANFKVTYWLPGNHEYYGYDAAERSGVVNEEIRGNVFLVNNSSVLLGSTKLIFTTLWSEITLSNREYIERFMNDFHAIKFHERPFTDAIFNHFHFDAMNFLRTELNRPHAGKTVVISHHVPTFLHYPKQYIGDRLNEAFGVELFDFIENSSVDYWIYGHHHNNIPDFLIGKTNLLTNQLGYVSCGEHLLFNSEKTIDLGEE